MFYNFLFTVFRTFPTFIILSYNVTKMVIIVRTISEVSIIISWNLFYRAFCSMACVYMKECSFIGLLVSLVV